MSLNVGDRVLVKQLDGDSVKLDKDCVLGRRGTVVDGPPGFLPDCTGLSAVKVDGHPKIYRFKTTRLEKISVLDALAEL
jgi:hypothetical protein